MRVKDAPTDDADHAQNVLIAAITVIAAVAWGYVFLLVARLL